MKRAAVALAAASALVMAGAASAVSWQTPVGTNVVADGVITGGGYPVPPGATRPDPGTCRSGLLQREPLRVLDRGQARHRGPGRQLEVLLRQVQHLLRLPSRRRTPSRTGAVTGEQPGPGVRLRLDRHAGHAAELDEQHRPERRLRHPGPGLPDDAAVQRVLGGRTCTRTARSTSPTATTWAPTGSRATAARTWSRTNNQTSLQLGHVEDKQWIAVNHFVGNRFQDHVYAAWTMFNGAAGNGKIRLAVSRDRGQTFRKAITITRSGRDDPGDDLRLPVGRCRRDALRRVRRRLRHDEQEPRRRTST